MCPVGLRCSGVVYKLNLASISIQLNLVSIIQCETILANQNKFQLMRQITKICNYIHYTPKKTSSNLHIYFSRETYVANRGGRRGSTAGHYSDVQKEHGAVDEFHEELNKYG